MKPFLPIALRLLLVGGTSGLGYLYFAKPQNLPAPLQNAASFSTQQVDKVLAVIEQTGIPDQAANLLTKPQSIVEDAPQIAQDRRIGDQVQGVNTSQVTEQAQKVINQTVSQVSGQLQSLPKKEAAKILRQTCEQIAADLEK